MDNTPISHVIIFGNDISALTCALGLAKMLVQRGIRLTVISSKKSETSNNANFLTPSYKSFHKKLKIDDSLLIKNTSATFFLGNTYHHWHQKDHHFKVPFSGIGFDLKHHKFHDLILLSDNKKHVKNFHNYSISSQAIQEGRFKKISSTDSILSTLSHGLVIDESAYCTLLSNTLNRFPVKQISEEITNLETDKDQNIKSVVTQTGKKLTADLFIDCSSSKLSPYKELNKKELSDILRYDTSIQFYLPKEHLELAAKLETFEDGYIRKMTTQDRCYYEAYINSQKSDVSSAIKVLDKRYSPKEINVFDKKPFTRKAFWFKNYICLGCASNQLHNYFVSNIHLVQSETLKLIELFPETNDFTINALEYSRQVKGEVDNILDFHGLHALSSKKIRWNDIKKLNTSDIPDQLLHHLKIFQARGLLPILEDNYISEKCWVALLTGLGIWPNDFDPTINQFDKSWANSELGKMIKLIKDAVDSLPKHDNYLTSLNI